MVKRFDHCPMTTPLQEVSRYEGSAIFNQSRSGRIAQARQSDPLPRETVVGFVETWTRFPGHGLSFWDSAIVAAAGALGCRELYSEDFGLGRTIDGIAISNPFLRTRRLK